MTRCPSLAFLLLTACGADLPGDWFEVTFTTTSDGCNDPEVRAEETWLYRVVVDGTAGDLFLADQPFATGTVEGCNFRYGTPLFSERRENGASVRWTLTGEARFAAGDGCDAGEGWSGTETITIISSSDGADVPAGCRHELAAEGRFLPDGP